MLACYIPQAQSYRIFRVFRWETGMTYRKLSLFCTETLGIPLDKKVKELSRELDSISKIRVPSGRPLTLQKRIRRYRDDMMRFVTTPGVDWHNNRSEGTLRPMVISRKMSFGSDTPGGAKRTAVLHSIVETCRLQNISPVKLLKEKMIRGRTGDCPLTQLLTSKLKC